MQGGEYEANLFIQINDDKNKEGGFSILPIHFSIKFFSAIRDGLKIMFGTQQEF